MVFPNSETLRVLGYYYNAFWVLRLVKVFVMCPYKSLLASYKQGPSMPLVICYQLAQLVKIQRCGIGPQMGQLASCRAAPSCSNDPEMHVLFHREQRCELGWLGITYHSYYKYHSEPGFFWQSYWPQPCLGLPILSKMSSQFMYSSKILMSFHPTDHLNFSTLWETVVK